MVRDIIMPLPSLGFGLLVIRFLFSIEFNILEILFDSNPIIGPIEVDGLPFSGSILIKVKPIENVTSYFDA